MDILYATSAKIAEAGVAHCAIKKDVLVLKRAGCLQQ